MKNDLSLSCARVMHFLSAFHLELCFGPHDKCCDYVYSTWEWHGYTGATPKTKVFVRRTILCT